MIKKGNIFHCLDKTATYQHVYHRIYKRSGGPTMARLQNEQTC